MSSSVKGKTLRVPEDARQRLDVFLQRAARLGSRQTARKLILAGKVLVDGEKGKPGLALRGGELVKLTGPLSERPSLEAQPIPLRVIYRDAELMVIDKPAGLVVHPGAGRRDGTLANALVADYQAQGKTGLRQGGGESQRQGEGDSLRRGIVHRLDKDTSGLMVVARRSGSEAFLREEIKARRVERAYLALVHGALTGSGLVDAPHGRDPRRRQRFAVLPAGGKEARTRFRALRRLGAASLLECRLETGRTHQIRVHMSFIGHPLLGDKAYGRADAWPRQMLHAWRLEFAHPVDGRRLSFRCPPPEDFLVALSGLGLSRRELDALLSSLG